MNLKTTAATLAALGLGASAMNTALKERQLLISWGITGLMSRRPLGGPVRLPEGVQWWDDWFTIEQIDGKTWAIGEPRYYKLNHSYLILGDEQALLFDSGPGVRPIGAVVADLTSMPVTVLASHLHFDHVGGHVDFDRVAIVEIPGLVEADTGGTFRPRRHQHLGALESGSNRPLFRVQTAWNPGEVIDLGHRQLSIVLTPGHAQESICLLDTDSNQMFSGDTLYEGELLAALPGSSLDAYTRSVAQLAEMVDEETLIMGAHSTDANPRASRLNREDLLDLGQLLEDLGPRQPSRLSLPKRHVVNERIRLFVA